MEVQIVYVRKGGLRSCEGRVLRAGSLLTPSGPEGSSGTWKFSDAAGVPGWSLPRLDVICIWNERGCTALANLSHRVGGARFLWGF